MPTWRMNYEAAFGLKRSQLWFIGVPINHLYNTRFNSKSLLFRCFSEVNADWPNEGYMPGRGDKNRTKASQKNATPYHQCFFWPFVSLRKKRLPCTLQKLTIEFTQNMIRLFWVQRLWHSILSWRVRRFPRSAQCLGYFRPNCPLTAGHFLRATFQ